jgi:hypothetical protein
MTAVLRRGAIIGLAALTAGGGLAGLRAARAETPEEPSERFVAELAERMILAFRDPSLDDRQRLVRIDGVTTGSLARIPPMDWHSASPVHRFRLVGQDLTPDQVAQS